METSNKNSNAGSIVLHVLGWTELPRCLRSKIHEWSYFRVKHANSGGLRLGTDVCRMTE
jgi:hypothetical protein